MGKIYMKFRFHKGKLKDSLLTVIDVKNEEELKNEISKFYNDEVKKLSISYLCYDKRIGWKTYVVINDKDGKGSYVCGFLNGCFVKY